MRALAAAITLIAFTGCSEQAERIEQSSNPKINIETLFRHDGCVVYRFTDSGRYHYFTRCGLCAETISQYTCGKSCEADENIKTQSR